MEITSFNGFLSESSSDDDIDITYNNTERQTWTKTMSAAVMECYFLNWSVDEESKSVSSISEIKILRVLQKARIKIVARPIYT